MTPSQADLLFALPVVRPAPVKRPSLKRTKKLFELPVFMVEDLEQRCVDERRKMGRRVTQTEIVERALTIYLQKSQKVQPEAEPACQQAFSKFEQQGHAITDIPKPVPPSRVGRVLIGGHFAPEVQTALKIIAAEERTSMQALIEEAINAVFESRNREQSA